MLGVARTLAIGSCLGVLALCGPAAAQARARRCTPPGPSPAAERDRGVEALLADRPVAAAESFERAVLERPQDLAAEMLHDASVARARAMRDEAAARVAKPIMLGALQLTTAEPAAHKLRITPGPIPVRLVKQSSKRNLIVDDGDWFVRNELPPPVPLAVAAPEYVPSQVAGQDLAALYPHRDHIVARYGDAFVAVAAEGKRPRAFYLGAVSPDIPSLQVNYAQLVGDTLLLQLSHPGYASSTGGRNGYVAAYAADTGALLWQSAPLAGNAANFVVLGDVLLTGYGFTAEPDFVYALELKSGRVLSKTSVHGGPDYLVRKGDRLYVRTYDMDYVFRLVASAALPEPQAAALADAPSKPTAAVDPELVCWVRVAAAAVDARDPDSLVKAQRALQARASNPALLSAIDERLAFVKHAHAGGVLDLWSVAPQRLPAAPFARKLIAATAPLPKGRPPKLVKLSVADADPGRVLNDPPFSPDLPTFIPPIKQGALPRGARQDIPTHYGRASLSAIIPSGDRLLLVYGGTYLAVVRRTTVERLLDLDVLRHPPRAQPQNKEFAIQDLTYAQIDGNALYVCNGGGSYAREVYGKKGFVSAIDLGSGALRWRSDPLVCNATFAVYGDYMITGYGFTDEPDFAVLLRLADGKRISKLPLKSGPDDIKLEGNRVRIETYAHSYELELK